MYILHCIGIVVILRYLTGPMYCIILVLCIAQVQCQTILLYYIGIVCIAQVLCRTITSVLYYIGIVCIAQVLCRIIITGMLDVWR